MSCRSRSKLIVCLTLLVTLLGCGVSDNVTGLWWNRQDPVRVEGHDDPAVPRYLEGGYLQLVLGQFGAEVAGVVRVYDSPTFEAEMCPCSFIRGGRVRDGVLTFSFNACSAEGELGVLNAALRLDESLEPAQLRGTLVLPGEDVPFAEVSLELDLPEKGVQIEQKLCEPDDYVWAPDGDGAERGDADASAGDAGGGDDAR